MVYKEEITKEMENKHPGKQGKVDWHGYLKPEK